MERTPVGDPRSLSSPVIVLGATSLVGRCLIQRLSEATITTISVSRHEQAPLAGVTWITGDLANMDFPPDIGARVAFSVSPIWLMPRALPSLHLTGVRRLVAFSSTSRFTKGSSPVASERATAQRLADGEACTRSFCESHEIAWTLLRPTLIYQDGLDRSVTRLAHIIRRLGFLPLSGDGGGMRQPVHADDLAQGAISAAVSPAAENRDYNLPGGETLSYRAMAERIFEGMGRRPRVVSVPPAIWRIGLGVAAPLLPGATTAMGSRMAEDLAFDGTPAQKDIQWRPRGFHPHFD